MSEATPTKILEEGFAAFGVLFRARREREQQLLAVRVDRPRAQHRFPRLPGPKSLRDAVDVEIEHRVLRQIARGERLVLRPQPLGDLAHGRARQQRAAALVGERRFDVAHRQPSCVHLHRQPLELLGAFAEQHADPRPERLFAITHLRRRVLTFPSAVRSRALR